MNTVGRGGFKHFLMTVQLFYLKHTDACILQNCWGWCGDLISPWGCIVAIVAYTFYCLSQLKSWLGMSTAKTIVKNCNLHTWIPFPMPLLRHISVCKASPFFSHALVALTTGWPLPFEQLYFSDNQHLTKWKWGAPSLKIRCIMDHEKWENFKEDIVTLCWNYYSETVAAFYTISVI